MLEMELPYRLAWLQDRRAELLHRRATGLLDDDAVEDRAANLSVTDGDGVVWTVGMETGRFYRGGPGEWEQADPPLTDPVMHQPFASVN